MPWPSPITTFALSTTGITTSHAVWMALALAAHWTTSPLSASVAPCLLRAASSASSAAWAPSWSSWWGCCATPTSWSALGRPFSTPWDWPPAGSVLQASPWLETSRWIMPRCCITSGQGWPFPPACCSCCCSPSSPTAWPKPVDSTGLATYVASSPLWPSSLLSSVVCFSSRRASCCSMWQPCASGCSLLMSWSSMAPSRLSLGPSPQTPSWSCCKPVRPLKVTKARVVCPAQAKSIATQRAWPWPDLKRRQLMVGTLKLGSASGSPALSVSKTTAASECVCAYTWTCGALPSWWELQLGLLWQPVSPEGATCLQGLGSLLGYRDAGLVLLSAEPIFAPAPSSRLSRSESAAVQGKSHRGILL